MSNLNNTVVSNIIDFNSMISNPTQISTEDNIFIGIQNGTPMYGTPSEAFMEIWKETNYYKCGYLPESFNVAKFTDGTYIMRVTYMDGIGNIPFAWVFPPELP